MMSLYVSRGFCCDPGAFCHQVGVGFRVQTADEDGSHVVTAETAHSTIGSQTLVEQCLTYLQIMHGVKYG